MNVRKIAGAAVAFALMADSANAQWFGTNSDQDFQKQQEAIMKQAFNSVGMPAITNFAERRQLKQIFELRDQNVATYTYLVGMDGKVGQKLCNSVGFGIPYATQYTSPMRLATRGTEGITTVPQADPNTLFSPASAEGTWVLCLNPETNKPTPLYVEPKIIVSPFKLVKE
jgi:hypothetical protein